LTFSDISDILRIILLLKEIKLIQEVVEMKAVKKFAEVERDKSVKIKSLPFKPGSKVEVIVLPASEREDIFNFMDNVMLRKKIAPLGMKEIEKIIHEVRGVK
jgi:hypothetical protein